MDIPNIGQTLLYFAGGALPLIGLWRFYEQYKAARLPAMKYEHRTDYVQERIATRNRRLAGTDADGRVWAVAEVDDWQAKELAKEDPWGRRYDDSDQFLGFISPGAESLTTYRQWRNDLRFVGAGIICATLASIWAVWF